MPQREGTYDEVTTNPASLSSVPLPSLSSTLGHGTQVANDEGIIVSQLGSAGLSPAQWTALQAFERQFQVPPGHRVRGSERGHRHDLREFDLHRRHRRRGPDSGR